MVAYAASDSFPNSRSSRSTVQKSISKFLISRHVPQLPIVYYKSSRAGLYETMTELDRIKRHYFRRFANELTDKYNILGGDRSTHKVSASLVIVGAVRRVHSLSHDRGMGEIYRRSECERLSRSNTVISESKASAMQSFGNNAMSWPILTSSPIKNADACQSKHITFTL